MTNNITTNLNIILAKLSTTYGNVTDEDVGQKETDLFAKVFNITQLLVNLYQEIDALQQLATAERSPFSDKQQYLKGFKLIKNMRQLEECRAS